MSDIFGARSSSLGTTPVASGSSGPFETPPVDGVTGDSSASGPPIALIGVIAIELAISAVLFVFATRVLNFVGYLIGAIAVAATAVLFRSIDSTRRRSPNYVSSPWAPGVVVVALIAGIVLGALHAFFFAKSHTVQSW